MAWLPEGQGGVELQPVNRRGFLFGNLLHFQKRDGGAHERLDETDPGIRVCNL